MAENISEIVSDLVGGGGPEYATSPIAVEFAWWIGAFLLIAAILVVLVQFRKVGRSEADIKTIFETILKVYKTRLYKQRIKINGDVSKDEIKRYLDNNKNIQTVKNQEIPLTSWSFRRPCFEHLIFRLKRRLLPWRKYIIGSKVQINGKTVYLACINKGLIKRRKIGVIPFELKPKLWLLNSDLEQLTKDIHKSLSNKNKTQIDANMERYADKSNYSRIKYRHARYKGKINPIKTHKMIRARCRAKIKGNLERIEKENITARQKKYNHHKKGPATREELKDGIVKKGFPPELVEKLITQYEDNGRIKQISDKGELRYYPQDL